MISEVGLSRKAIWIAQNGPRTVGRIFFGAFVFGYLAALAIVWMPVGWSRDSCIRDRMSHVTPLVRRGSRGLCRNRRFRFVATSCADQACIFDRTNYSVSTRTSVNLRKS